MSISVCQYFLRYDRLLTNTYSNHFFNGQSLLISKHTNVALILSGSLALILAYNSIFYMPRTDREISVLPLVTFNTILLVSVNVIILLCIIFFTLNGFFSRRRAKSRSSQTEQETLRLLIEKSACTKCYSKILQKNANLFQDKDHPYANLYRKFSLNQIPGLYPLSYKRHHMSQTKKTYYHIDLSPTEVNENENTMSSNQFFRATLNKLNSQHTLCQLCHHLLLVLMLKYSLLTSPLFVDQMLFYMKDLCRYVFRSCLAFEQTQSGFYNSATNAAMIYHCLFLLSRLGDSLLLTRLPSLMKKYFPCWCQCNTKFCHQKPGSHCTLSTKTSESSNHEAVANALDEPVPIELQHESRATTASASPSWRQKRRRRLRLRFQYVPLWSHHRPRLFKESVWQRMIFSFSVSLTLFEKGSLE